MKQRTAIDLFAALFPMVLKILDLLDSETPLDEISINNFKKSLE